LRQSDTYRRRSYPLPERKSMKKVLGKIQSAEYGLLNGSPYFGLYLAFSINGGSQGCNSSTKYMFNISKDCKWSENNRSDAVAELVDDLHSVLKAAKVNYVSELAGKPVEITLDGNLFKGFRILTEVL